MARFGLDRVPWQFFVGDNALENMAKVFVFVAQFQFLSISKYDDDNRDTKANEHLLPGRDVLNLKAWGSWSGRDDLIASQFIDVNLENVALDPAFQSGHRVTHSIGVIQLHWFSGFHVFSRRFYHGEFGP